MNSTETSVYARQLRSVFSHLSINDDLVYINAKCIVLPIAAVKNILVLAHTTHSGISKTYKLCRSMYFWPGIKQMISACRPCSLNASSLPKNPRSTLPPSSHLGPPMAHVGVELLDFSGKSHLVCVNRWSGYPMFTALGSTSTTSITRTLQSGSTSLAGPDLFAWTGVPNFVENFCHFVKNLGSNMNSHIPTIPVPMVWRNRVLKLPKICFRNAWGRERTFSEFSMSGEICLSSKATLLLSLCWQESAAAASPAGKCYSACRL